MTKAKIGIRFIDHKGWTGGVYYILNLLNSFSTLPAEKQPDVVIFCNTDEEAAIRGQITYPHVRFFFLDKKLSVIQRAINKMTSIFGKTVYSTLPPAGIVDLVFPNPELYYFKNIPGRVSWIPDFQEDHLPQFFTPEEVASRKKMQQRIADNAPYIVLSSESVKADFHRLYPSSPAKIFVLNFAVTHPSYKELDPVALRKKYDLPENYFFSPNQFWTHKNHVVVIRAVEELKKQNVNVTVAFSGKEQDYRDPEYTGRIKKMVHDLGLEKNIRFLGFLDRREQLQLMNHAMAIIQPSLFEGWSTVVEDAKAMSQVILASDLDVHKEQLEKWEGQSLFFPRNEAHVLAEKMLEVQNGKFPRRQADYTKLVKQYAENFTGLFHEVAGK